MPNPSTPSLASPASSAPAWPGGSAEPQEPGLVTCRTSVRTEAVPDDLSGLSVLADVWRPRFPKADLVALAAAQLPALPAWQGEEGPRWRITVSPGALTVACRDRGKAERTHERHAGFYDEYQRTSVPGSDAKMTDVTGQFLAEGGQVDDTGDPVPCGCGNPVCEGWGGIPGRSITHWSRQSRCNMTRTLCELDYEPLLAQNRMLAMITLTYPGDWLAVAPDGKAVKRHMACFRRRWARAWGETLAGIWKLEFQDRGAPHIHLLAGPPVVLSPDGRQFKQWLSETWAAIVAHPDPEQYRRHVLAGTGVDYAEGLRARDPKRISVYFTKHGTFSAKEYQNQVPLEWQEPGKGPGRFWGYWGLHRCAVSTDVEPQTAIDAARVLRRWSRAQGTTHEVAAPRVSGGRVASAYPAVVGLAGAMLLAAHPVRTRKVRRRVRRMRHGRGWVSLNDAPVFALELARYLGGRSV